jgi:hypothetical protein
MDINTSNFALFEQFLEIPPKMRKKFEGYTLVPRNEWLETIKIGDKLNLMNIKTGNVILGAKLLDVYKSWEKARLLYRRKEISVSTLWYAIWRKPEEKKENKFQNMIKLVVKKLDSVENEDE